MLKNKHIKRISSFICVILILTCFSIVSFADDSVSSYSTSTVNNPLPWDYVIVSSDTDNSYILIDSPFRVFSNGNTFGASSSNLISQSYTNGSATLSYDQFYRNTTGDLVVLGNAGGSQMSLTFVMKNKVISMANISKIVDSFTFSFLSDSITSVYSEWSGTIAHTELQADSRYSDEADPLHYAGVLNTYTSDSSFTGSSSYVINNGSKISLYPANFISQISSRGYPEVEWVDLDEEEVVDTTTVTSNYYCFLVRELTFRVIINGNSNFAYTFNSKLVSEDVTSNLIGAEYAGYWYKRNWRNTTNPFASMDPLVKASGSFFTTDFFGNLSLSDIGLFILGVAIFSFIIKFFLGG